MRSDDRALLFLKIEILLSLSAKRAMRELTKLAKRRRENMTEILNLLREGKLLEQRLRQIKEEIREYTRVTGVAIDLENWRISGKNLFYDK